LDCKTGREAGREAFREAEELIDHFEQPCTLLCIAMIDCFTLQLYLWPSNFLVL